MEIEAERRMATRTHNFRRRMERVIQNHGEIARRQLDLIRFLRALTSTFNFPHGKRNTRDIFRYDEYPVNLPVLMRTEKLLELV